MTNRKNGTLYTGSCIDLIKRVYQHKEKYVRGFTQKYNLSSLVYFEEHYQPLKKSFNLNAGDGSGKLG
jgi:putative endonuclease